jgi:serine/threonine protein kinase
MPSKSTIDHYVCTKTLGAGISGKVKLATDSNTGKKVALKIFDKSDP